MILFQADVTTIQAWVSVHAQELALAVTGLAMVMGLFLLERVLKRVATSQAAIIDQLQTISRNATPPLKEYTESVRRIEHPYAAHGTRETELQLLFHEADELKAAFERAYPQKRNPELAGADSEEHQLSAFLLRQTELFLQHESDNPEAQSALKAISGFAKRLASASTSSNASRNKTSIRAANLPTFQNFLDQLPAVLPHLNVNGGLISLYVATLRNLCQSRGEPENISEVRLPRETTNELKRGIRKVFFDDILPIVDRIRYSKESNTPDVELIKRYEQAVLSPILAGLGISEIMVTIGQTIADSRYYDIIGSLHSRHSPRTVAQINRRGYKITLANGAIEILQRPVVYVSI